mgnify:CR=1 FL=1
MVRLCAIGAMRARYPQLAVIGVEPGLKPAAGLSRSKVVGVLATTRTLHSDRFQRLVGNHANHVRVLAQACPGLADTIEHEGADSPAVGKLLDAYIAPLAAAGAAWAAPTPADQASPATIAARDRRFNTLRNIHQDPTDTGP